MPLAAAPITIAHDDDALPLQPHYYTAGEPSAGPRLPLAARNLLLVAHVILIVGAMLVALLAWDPRWLMAVIFVLYTISLQWNMFGKCVLNRWEKEDSGTNTSVFVEGVARATGLSVQQTEMLWPLPTNYLPAMLCLWKLGVLLGRRAR